jgi:hypothetical protein
LTPSNLIVLLTFSYATWNILLTYQECILIYCKHITTWKSRFVHITNRTVYVSNFQLKHRLPVTKILNQVWCFQHSECKTGFWKHRQPYTVTPLSYLPAIFAPNDQVSSNCRIWRSHSGGYRKILNSGIQCCVVHWKSTKFWRTMSPPSSGYELLTATSWWFLALLILQPWRWIWDVPLKCWLIFKRLHGVTYQKINLFFSWSSISYVRNFQIYFDEFWASKG